MLFDKKEYKERLKKVKDSMQKLLRMLSNKEYIQYLLYLEIAVIN